MKIFRSQVGNTTIFVQTIEEEIEIIGDDKGRATQLTGVRDKFENAYGKLKTSLKEIAVDIGSELKAIEKIEKPKTVEIEFKVINYFTCFLFICSF